MSLQDRLDALKTRAAADPNRNPEATVVLNRVTDDLIRSGIAGRALRVGDQIPAFVLQDVAGRSVCSREFLAKGPLVVSFYRGAWCPYCLLELEALQAAVPDFAALDAGLIAISPNLEPHARRTVRELGLTFPVLIDRGNVVARQFGLVWQFPYGLRTVYRGWGVDLARFNGDDSWTLPMSARFVIAPDGTVAHAEVNPDYTRRPDPSETIEVVRTLTAPRQIRA